MSTSGPVLLLVVVVFGNRSEATSSTISVASSSFLSLLLPSPHPSKSGFSLQYSSSETPAAQDMHWAFIALQQGPGMASAAISVPFAMVSFASVALAQALPFSASLTLQTTSVTLSTATLAVSLTFPTTSLPLSTTALAVSLTFPTTVLAVSAAWSTAPETSEARSESFLLLL